MDEGGRVHMGSKTDNHDKRIMLDSLGRINNTIKLQKVTVHLFVAQWYLPIKSLIRFRPAILQ